MGGMVERNGSRAAALAAGLVVASLVASVDAGGQRARAATIAPPMLDVTRQCNANHHNATAMSECVVAESEARAAILQRWSKFSDAEAEKCVKAGRKAKHNPYSAMAKCLGADPQDALAPAPAPAAVR